MGRQDVAEIERHVLEVVPQARFVEGADRPCRQSRGHQQNKQAGPLEERAQVKTNAAPVEQETKHNRRGQPEHRAQRRPDAHVLLKSREQEEHGLQAFTRHGEKDHHDQRPAVVVAFLQGVIHRLLKLYLHVTGNFAHPEHHPGEDHHRYYGNNAFKQLLLFLRKFTSGFVDKNTQPQAERRGKENANPHHANPASALGTLQITGDKANNQGRFKAFT